jgi:ubiquinone/menaquinone biosynthesis C-methylase UbiE
VKKLNIGCGELPIAIKDNDVIINLDKRQTELADVIHDMNVLPLPFGDKIFDEVYGIDILEHILHIVPLMDELHRITKEEGLLFIRSTLCDHVNAFTDPTHYHYFTPYSFDYFDPQTKLGEKYGYYSEKKWSIEEKDVDGSVMTIVLKKR